MDGWKDFRLALIIGFVGGVVLVLSFLFLIYLFLGPYAGLPATLPKNATSTEILVTQSSEISKVSGLILTIEGILLGLSPLYFDKLGRAKLGASAMSVTAVALFLSLITVLFADTNANPDILVWIYFVDILGLLFLTVFYVGSAWYVVLVKKRPEKERESDSQQKEHGEPKANRDKEFVDIVEADTEQKIEVEDLRMLFDARMGLFSSAWVFLLGLAVILIQAGSLSTSPSIIDLSRYLLAVLGGVWAFYYLAFKRTPKLTWTKMFEDYVRAKDMIRNRSQK